MKAFLIFFISVSVFAHSGDCPHCNHDTERETFSQKLLNWFSTQNSEVKKAPCKTKKVPSDQEMRAYINSKLLGSFSWEVNGVQLEEESPILVQAFTDFTTSKDLYGTRLLKSSQKNFQHEFGINPECKKTLCALEKIWGKEMAVKMLYVYLKHGYNVSEYAFDESSRFRKDELDDVIKALDDLPPHLIPVAMKNQRLTKYSNSDLNDKTLANAVIMLFDRWSMKYSTERQYTVFHELAHNISMKLKDMDENPEWLALSGWVKRGDDWEAESEKKCFISNYAKANAWEDFAETLSAYRYNGNALKTQCPEKYNFIKSKVMNGLEYLSETTCKP